MTPDSIRALEDLMSTATPGPWIADTSIRSFAVAIRHDWMGGRKTVGYIEGPGLDATRRPQGLKNGAFIVAMRNALPDLLAHIYALTRERDTLERELNLLREKV